MKKAIKMRKSVTGWAREKVLDKFGKWFENTDGHEYAFHGIHDTKASAKWCKAGEKIIKVRVTIEKIRERK